MSESLRNDGRIWVPKNMDDVKALRAGVKKPSDIAEEDRDYYLERRYPAFGNLVPRDVASRAAKERCDAGYGVNNTGLAVFLDFTSVIFSYIWKRLPYLALMTSSPRRSIAVLKSRNTARPVLLTP